MTAAPAQSDARKMLDEVRKELKQTDARKLLNDVRADIAKGNVPVEPPPPPAPPPPEPLGFGEMAREFVIPAMQQTAAAAPERKRSLLGEFASRVVQGIGPNALRQAGGALEAAGAATGIDIIEDMGTLVRAPGEAAGLGLPSVFARGDTSRPTQLMPGGQILPIPPAVQRFTGDLGQTAGGFGVQIAGTTALSALGFNPIMAFAATGGVQVVGDQYLEARDYYRAEGVPEEEAKKRAAIEAGTAGIISGVTNFGLGKLVTATPVVKGLVDKSAAKAAGWIVLSGAGESAQEVTEDAITDLASAALRGDEKALRHIGSWEWFVGKARTAGLSFFPGAGAGVVTGRPLGIPQRVERAKEAGEAVAQLDPEAATKIAEQETVPTRKDLPGTSKAERKAFQDEIRKQVEPPKPEEVSPPATEETAPVEEAVEPKPTPKKIPVRAKPKPAEPVDEGVELEILPETEPPPKKPRRKRAAQDDIPGVPSKAEAREWAHKQHNKLELDAFNKMVSGERLDGPGSTINEKFAQKAFDEGIVDNPSHLVFFLEFESKFGEQNTKVNLESSLETFRRAKKLQRTYASLFDAKEEGIDRLRHARGLTRAVEAPAKEGAQAELKARIEAEGVEVVFANTNLINFKGHVDEVGNRIFLPSDVTDAKTLQAMADKLTKDVDNTEVVGHPELNPRGQTNRPADPVLGDAAVASPIAPKLHGNLVAPHKAGKTNAPKVINKLADIAKAAGAEVPIRIGKVTKRNASGIFKIRPEVVRIRVANNITTATHEVGHALEKAVFGWPKGSPWKLPRVGRTIQSEMFKLGKALYGNEKPAGGYKREGFAEYVRIWVTEDRGNAAKVAPEFTKWFEGTFLKDLPKVRKALEDARTEVDTWKEMGSAERGKASIVDPASLPARVGKLKNATQDAAGVSAWIEMAQPIHTLSREAEKRLGKPLEPDQDPFQTLSALRTTHASRTAQMVNNQMIDLAGNPVGPPLQDAAALVKGKQKDFTIYLWARRALALINDPNGPREPGISREDATQIIKELDSPTFQLAASKVYDWNDGVLDYAAQASPSFAALVGRIRATDPGNYIPLQRVFEQLDSIWSGSGGRGRIQGGSFVKRLKGSGRRIKEPFQTMIAQAQSTVAAAHRRLILDQIISLSKVEGMGHIIEKVPRDMVPASHQNLADLIENVQKQVEKQGGKLKLEGKDVDDFIGESLTFFSPAATPKSGQPIIPVWNDGTIEWYEVNPKLFRALDSMDVYRANKAIEMFFGVPAQIFRAGTTGYRASFGLITNPQRDVQTMYLNTQANANAGRLFFEWLSAMGGAITRHVTLDRVRTPWVDAFLRLGGEMAQPLGQDIGHTRRAARRLFEGPVIKTIDPRNILDGVRDLIQIPESAPRIAEMKLLAKEIGWKPGTPMTLSQSLQLLLASKQVTTDFTAAGEFGRTMNRAVPFFNASIQGPRANIRAMKRDPAKFLSRGLGLTAATLALWWTQKDEEWYQEMRLEERFLFWYIPITMFGEQTLLRIPRAFEVGMIFASFPEMLADAWYQQEPEQAKEYFEKLIDVARPPVTPVLIREGAEQLRNRDYFWDTPIVPQGQEKLPPEEQYNEFTSRAAIFLGETFAKLGVKGDAASPRRIEHAIKGVGGGVASDILRTLGIGKKDLDKEGELSDTFLIGRMFRRGGRMGSRPRSVDKLYDNYEDALRTSRSSRIEETAGQRQLRLMLSDATSATSAMFFVRSRTRDTEKRNAITKEIAALAREANAMVEAGQVTQLQRGRVRALKKRAEFKKEAKKRELNAK